MRKNIQLFQIVGIKNYDWLIFLFLVVKTNAHKATVGKWRQGKYLKLFSGQETTGFMGKIVSMFDLKKPL